MKFKCSIYIRILLTNITSPHICICLKSGPVFPTSYALVFYMFNCLRFVLLILVELLTSLFKPSFHNMHDGMLVVMHILKLIFFLISIKECNPTPILNQTHMTKMTEAASTSWSVICMTNRQEILMYIQLPHRLIAAHRGTTKRVTLLSSWFGPSNCRIVSGIAIALQYKYISGNRVRVMLRFMVFNATFNNISVISWLSVLLVD